VCAGGNTHTRPTDGYGATGAASDGNLASRVNDAATTDGNFAADSSANENSNTASDRDRATDAASDRNSATDACPDTDAASDGNRAADTTAYGNRAAKLCGLLYSATW
jgi:hypothetical protein